MRRFAAVLVAALVSAPTAFADGEIHSIDVDGTGRRNLTESPDTWDGQPRPSPDGSRIAFVRTGATGERDVWVMNADGTAQRPIARPGYDWNPVWSADGARIAFTRSWSVPGRLAFDSRYAIEIVDSSSGLTLKRLGGLRDPRFSPDGRWLTARGGQNGSTLWLLDADGKRRALIAAFEGGEPTDHVWSPDSSKIAIEVQRVITFYRSPWQRPAGDGLYVFHLYGRTLQLLRGLTVDPAWSPGGSLAFTWWRVEPGLVTTPVVWGLAQDIWQVVPGEAPRRTSDRSATLFSSVPAFSPDGRLLAFSGQERWGSWGALYVANADGTGARRLAADESGRSSTGPPVWMPDGRRLLFTCC